MNLKFKIVFYNLMIFLIIFDIIYLLVWIFSIHMNPTKGLIVAGIATALTPWAKATNLQSGRKVFFQIYALTLWNKYVKKAH